MFDVVRLAEDGSIEGVRVELLDGTFVGIFFHYTSYVGMPSKPTLSNINIAFTASNNYRALNHNGEGKEFE